MKVERIIIRNILGVESLDFAPGAVTRVTGANAAGKTSVLEAIKAVAKGGHDATLLRQGQKSGEIVLVFDSGEVVTKRVGATSSPLSVQDADGDQRSSPATFIKQLWDALSANPVEFITGSPKQRLAWLLEAFPPDADLQALHEIVGADSVQDGANALETIAATHKAVFEQRREVKRALKQDQATVAGLEADLPPADADYAAELRAAETAHQNARSALEAALVTMRAHRGELRTDALQRRNKLVDAANREYEEKLEQIETEFGQANQATRDKHEPEIAKWTAERSRVQQVAEASVAAAERRRLRDEIDDRATDSGLREVELDGQLEQIAKLRERLLDDVPIPDLSVVDGEIRIGDVPFDRLNTAAQWKLAIAIAKIRAGEIPVICADGLEALDDRNFEAFRDMAIDSGLQFIVTDRGEGPLRVEPEGVRQP